MAIEKLKKEQIAQGERGESLLKPKNDEKITQTEKFSREFFATVSTLSQNGELDQATIDKLSSSLAEQIKSSAPRKVFILADIKIKKDNSLQVIQKYSDTLNKIYSKTPPKNTVIDILQKFMGDGNNVNLSALSELDPIIKQMSIFINEMLKIETPESLATLHLNVINGFERVVENLNDIKLYDTDVIMALAGISKYEQNSTELVSNLQKLNDIVNKKLRN